jgi:glucosamine-6-phosphate deaminase
MKVIIEDKKRAVEIAVLIIEKLIQKKPNAVLGLATGKTMIPFYKELVSHYKKGKINFSKIKTFNLDEYVGNNKFHDYMKKNLFSKINIKKENTHFPSSKIKTYEKEIRKAGGIDLCLLGIGENAHIAFNEPSSPFNSETGKVITSDKKRAYTMGIKTILNSKKIILLAWGKEKAKAVHDSLKKKISERVPASALRKHKDATFILDKPASSKL